MHAQPKRVASSRFVMKREAHSTSTVGVLYELLLELMHNALNYGQNNPSSVKKPCGTFSLQDDCSTSDYYVLAVSVSQFANQNLGVGGIQELPLHLLRTVYQFPASSLHMALDDDNQSVVKASEFKTETIILNYEK